MPKLRIDAVRKRFGDVAALLDTSLDVEAGEFVTLLGPSGSGKTTLLSLIAGLIEPDAGRIVLDGRDLSGLPPHRRGLGMVFQSYALFPHLSVAENVAFGLRARRLPDAEVDAKVRRALGTVRLEALAHRLPRELSGGQQQRVALARAIAYDPGLVLMDEPLGALDRNLREELKGEIGRLHRELGTTVLYVTHDQEEALVLSDRICLMNRARIEQVDPPQRLYFAPRSRFAAEFLGESNLVPGRVGPDGRVEVDAWRSRLRVPGARERAAGEAVLLMVRPETIEWSPGDAADGPDAVARLTGRVLEHTFLGATVRCVLDVAGTRLTVLRRTASIGDARRLDAGTTATVAVVGERCHLLPAEAA